MRWVAVLCGLLGGILLLTSGGDVVPGPSGDDVSQAFATYESLWRDAQGELANRLEAGQITSESAAAEWFAIANAEARKQSFTPLLESEAAEYGGEQWTAEKHAAAIRRYVR